MSARYCLISPPLTDPTCPYHSISYLISAARAAGHREDLVIDANVEGLNYLSDPTRVGELLEWCQNRVKALEDRGLRTRQDQLLYRECLPAVGMNADAVSAAIRALKTPNEFYNYRTYRCAAQVIKRWTRLLSARGLPGHYHSFTMNMKGVVNVSRIEDLTNVSLRERLTEPFSPYFEGPLTDTLRDFTPDLVGISVPFGFQLPFALSIGQLVRQRFPDAKLCIGGTEVADVYKHLEDKSRLWEVFADFDWVVVGEGEATFVTLLDSVAQRSDPPSGVPGLLVRTRGRVEGPRPLHGPEPAKVQVQYEDVGAHSGPAYDCWNWDAYWSPESVALYSPVRGCYWNRCTFCDFGLNAGRPTAPSRERPVDQAVADLKAITKFANVVYFAVDAMSPRYLVSLAAALDESDVEISWSAELRLERAFRRELAQVLRSSGCVAISFGFESASQRVLGLIDKGVRLEEVPAMLEQLRGAEIGVQMMGFIGFPTETESEALQTFEFLQEHGDSWATAAIGDFVMTGGAIVARATEGFGTEVIGKLAGDDICRRRYWREADGRTRYPGDQRNPQIEAARLEAARHPLKRPFVGGVDTAHSLLYFRRFGRRLVPARADYTPDPPWYPEIVEHRMPFGSIEDLVSDSDLADLTTRRWAQGSSWGYKEAAVWLAAPVEMGEADGDGSSVVEILPSGSCATQSPGWRERYESYPYFSHSPAALVMERAEFVDSESS